MTKPWFSGSDRSWVFTHIEAVDPNWVMTGAVMEPTNKVRRINLKEIGGRVGQDLRMRIITTRRKQRLFFRFIDRQIGKPFNAQTFFTGFIPVVSGLLHSPPLSLIFGRRQTTGRQWFCS